ncbi:hypothetical protein LTR17_000764 [Elasticomyces elasticus]|nr:hypothetical protein LTR17_000764 [Elasticomyces elasticus]
MAPRPIRPKDEPDTSESSAVTADPKSNKRRAVSSACLQCRKRKSKCDGALPACSTCVAVYRTECSYDADSDHRRKGALKRDIQSLQQQNDALEVIVASLRSLPEDEAVSLLQNLRGESSFDVVAASLRTDVRLPHSYAPQTLEADFAQQMSQSTTVSGASTPANSFLIPQEAYTEEPQEALSLSPGTWFRQPQDAEFVEHLLNLHFSWVHPIYQSFPRELFLRDMGRGSTEYCSALLVNAVLALACHYSDRPAARTDPNNPSTAGDHFFQEARRLLYREERSCLTTVQALGVMATREVSQGRESNAYQYSGRCLRMAVELGLHLSVAGSEVRSAESEARKITFWAVFNLETACAVGFGRLSQLPRCAVDVAKPTINERLESAMWQPYHDVNMVKSPSIQQPSRPMLFVDCRSRLSELASDMVNTFYAPRERFTSRRLAATYAQYQEWYQTLPDAFRLENTALPHVLVMHMYYYACVLHLFRPYIKLDLRGAGLYPRETCTHCANEISNLTNALRAISGLRRVSLTVCNWIMTASTIHLLNLPSDVAANNLIQGMHDLQTMSVNHPFAARCIDIIRSLASKWHINMPEGANAIIGYRQEPSSQLTSPTTAFFAASIPRKQASEDRTESGSSMSSNRQPDTPFAPPPQQQSAFSFYSDPTAPMDENTAQHAFWTPFPLQGVPAVGLHDLSFDFTNSPMESMSNMQWPVFGSENSSMSHHSGHLAMSGTEMNGMGVTSGMGGGFGNWDWR